MRRLQKLTLLLLLLLGLQLVIAQPGWTYMPGGQDDTIVISGTVRGPGGGPVAGVHVEAWLPSDEGAVGVTNAGGYYQLALPAGDVAMHVGPPLETRLAERNRRIGYRDTSFTQNFDLLAGQLLAGHVRLPDGRPPDTELWLALSPYQFEIPQNEWLGAAIFPGSGQFQVVVPQDIYWVEPSAPPTAYPAGRVVDLRAGDVTGLELALADQPVNPIPYDPPVAAKITVGPVDGLGEALVTGAPGAALPLARVLLVNLNSTHQAHTISEADGSFSARIYAPPGSAIMIKHGPHNLRWQHLDVGVAEGLSPYPGTIINIPHTHTAAQGLPFAAAGAAEFMVDDIETTQNYVGSAWAISGVLGPAAAGQMGRQPTYAPGDELVVEGKMRLYSPAIGADTDLRAIAIGGDFNLMMIANKDGEPLAAKNSFMSSLLTPSGLPIQSGRRSIELGDAHVAVSELKLVGRHVIEGQLVAHAHLAGDLPPGVYRPYFVFGFSGVPSSQDWLAANVTGHYTFQPDEAPMPPITVGSVQKPRLIWRLLMDDVVQGTRGAAAREDEANFQLTSQIVTQGAPYYAPPVDLRTGSPISYRLEPFLPAISFADRRMPAPPLIPFDLPGGELCVTVQKPDGSTADLGCEAVAQSFNRTMTTRGGDDLNGGTVQMDDVYSLTAGPDRFRVTFDQYGKHTVRMTGMVDDSWGNGYAGGGTYDIWMAHPLDIDPGVLPGTPLAAGDAFNPALQFSPRVPAAVTLTITQYPGSDPAQKVVRTISGQANQYGYFSFQGAPLIMSKAGEYRVDAVASYSDADGKLYMGTMTWGGIVMTPPAQADLIAHGRRGLDSLPTIPNHWFVAARDLAIPAGSVSHALNPYFNGDILWSRMAEEQEGGNALLMGASVQDKVGAIEAALQARVNNVRPELSPPGSPEDRFAKGELPLFISTTSGRPAQIDPGAVDQIAYSYRTSQRPGVRVREVVAEDSESGGYWRLDTLYDDQLGVGVQGDLPNDFKFQYVGAVYRDLVSGQSEYVGQGTGWVFIPDEDVLGNRVMPPFAGPGNGGWTTEGGPLMTLQGEAVHLFILPTGVKPGAVLEVGDMFRFAGHIMPTLNSDVSVTVTSPSGVEHIIEGQANPIGYYYDPAADFMVDEAGVWSVDVDVWHDGQCSGGATVPPYPSGSVLGSSSGRYYFYVAPAAASRLRVSTPQPGFLTFDVPLTPIRIAGVVPSGLRDVTIDYTIAMPGFVLQQGEAVVSGSSYHFLFDPVALNQDFPNLDLVGRDSWHVGLADTFSIGLLLRGKQGGQTVTRANTITLQGNQVFVGGAFPEWKKVYLPMVQGAG